MNLEYCFQNNVSDIYVDIMFNIKHLPKLFMPSFPHILNLGGGEDCNPPSPSLRKLISIQAFDVHDNIVNEKNFLIVYFRRNIITKCH